MKVLISGGTGLIGKELGKTLALKNYKIFILSRSPRKTKLKCPFPHESFSWDELNNHSRWTDLDHIVNLAGTNITEKRWTGDFKKKILNSRIETTKKLIQFANHSCPDLKSFVSTSAIGFYGDAGKKTLSEDFPKAHSFLASVCDNWEKATRKLKRGRRVILRVGVVFSEKGGALGKMVPPIQAGVGGSIGDGRQFISWIDIEDLVNLYVFSLENPVDGIFNAVAPHPVPNGELTKMIGNHLGQKTFFKIPCFLLRILLGEMALHLVESQKISSEKVRKKGFKFLFPRVEDSIKKRIPKLKPLERRMIFEQWIPKTKEEVFPFFSSPLNLKRMTPENFKLKVLNVSSEPLTKGTEINYKLKVYGLSVHWKTLIHQWDPPNSFTDNQERGPYRKWSHLHKFTDLGKGTLMTDRVDMELPLGFPAYATASWKVFKDVKNIFDYRNKIIYNKFKNNNVK